MSETTTIRRENFMSDFDFILPLTDCQGNDLGWPDFDWEVGLWTTSQADMRRVGCRDGVPYGCFDDNGRVHVVLKDHGLRAGVLQARATAYLPNAIYPDGTQKRVRPSELSINLVRGAGDCPTATEVELMLPFIKGDKGDKMTYADLTDADKADLTNLAKMRLICDMFNAAAGNVGYARITDGAFDGMLNGLPLTYEEAVPILLYGRNWTYQHFAISPISQTQKIRTNLPPQAYSTAVCPSFDSLFRGQTDLEVVNVNPYYGLTYDYGIHSEQAYYADIFNGCGKLHTIYGFLDVSNAAVTAQWFKSCTSLREVRIRNLKRSISLADCPLISLDSIQYMVDKATNTTAITITVHPDVYAKLTAETNTEWHQVLTDALDKNITFATI